MNQTDINNAISQAFANLSVLNEQVYDYWVSELYDLTKDFGSMIVEKWNEQTLYEMETDVMMNSWMCYNWIIVKKRDKTLFFYVFIVKKPFLIIAKKIKSFSISIVYWESIRCIIENNTWWLCLISVLRPRNLCAF